MLGLDIDKNGFVHYQSTPLALARKEKGVLQLLLRDWPAMVPKACFAPRSGTAICPTKAWRVA